MTGAERERKAGAATGADEGRGELSVAEKAGAIERLIDEPNALRGWTRVVARLETMALRAEPFLRVPLPAPYALFVARMGIA